MKCTVIMIINIEVVHDDLYPNEEIHEPRIETFKFELNQEISPNLNLKKNHYCFFNYDTNTLKFKFLRSDSQFVSDRLEGIMKRNKYFYDDFINPDKPFTGNYFEI